MPALSSKIESLLFVSGDRLSLIKLAEFLDCTEDEVKTAMDLLMREYKENERGIVLLKEGNFYRLATHPDNAEVVQGYLNEEVNSELTKPSLETLSIVAYRGPIIKSELDGIRGINCSLILRNLMIKGLVSSEDAESGSPEDAVFQVTAEFMRLLGITDVKDLPDYDKLHGNADNFPGEVKV